MPWEFSKASVPWGFAGKMYHVSLRLGSVKDKESASVKEEKTATEGWLMAVANEVPGDNSGRCMFKTFVLRLAIFSGSPNFSLFSRREGGSGYI